MLRQWLKKKHPFLCSKGKPYNSVVAHSNYLEPIADCGLRGNSRIWGDAREEVQLQVIALLVAVFRAEGFSSDEIAFGLSLVRVESGYNPDAAAGTTSASGLGQFIDKTRNVLAERVGINNADEHKFNAVFNALILVPQLQDCFKFAKLSLGNKWIEAYRYHHDGGNKKDYGGAKIAQEKLLPLLPLAAEFIK